MLNDNWQNFWGWKSAFHLCQKLSFVQNLFCPYCELHLTENVFHHVKKICIIDRCIDTSKTCSLWIFTTYLLAILQSLGISSNKSSEWGICYATLLLTSMSYLKNCWTELNFYCIVSIFIVFIPTEIFLLFWIIIYYLVFIYICIKLIEKK